MEFFSIEMSVSWPFHQLQLYNNLFHVILFCSRQVFLNGFYASLVQEYRFGSYCVTNNINHEIFIIWCIITSVVFCFVLNTADLCSTSYQGIFKVHSAITELRRNVLLIRCCRARGWE